jgi:hypothetical protein
MTIKDVVPAECDRDIDEALSELERELQVRERCFDRWIAEGKISRIDAFDRFERMATAWRLLCKYSQASEKEA